MTGFRVPLLVIHGHVHTVLTRSPSKAAGFLSRGQLAAFPTETVYGLGADARNSAAVERIYKAKGRPLDNPLIVHIADESMLRTIVKNVPPSATRLIERFFPGPLTLVLPRGDTVPPVVSAGLNTLAVRMPAHPIAHDLLASCGFPVAAPSANRSGRPSPTTWEAVRDDLDGRIACILQGDRSTLGLESTVVDCTEDVPVLLRHGAVSAEELRAVVEIDAGATVSVSYPDRRSPGMQHQHYAPDAAVRMANSTLVPEPHSAYLGMNRPLHADDFELVKLCRDTAEYAHELFFFFRECERIGIRTIVCEEPPKDGIGSALHDRIQRASVRK